jgi:hypothetical protein
MGKVAELKVINLASRIFKLLFKLNLFLDDRCIKDPRLNIPEIVVRCKFPLQTLVHLVRNRFKLLGI